MKNELINGVYEYTPDFVTEIFTSKDETALYVTFNLSQMTDDERNDYEDGLIDEEAVAWKAIEDEGFEMGDWLYIARTWCGDEVYRHTFHSLEYEQSCGNCTPA